MIIENRSRILFLPGVDVYRKFCRKNAEPIIEGGIIYIFNGISTYSRVRVETTVIYCSETFAAIHVGFKFFHGKSGGDQFWRFYKLVDGHIYKVRWDNISIDLQKSVKENCFKLPEWGRFWMQISAEGGAE